MTQDTSAVLMALCALSATKPQVDIMLAKIAEGRLRQIGQSSFQPQTHYPRPNLHPKIQKSEASFEGPSLPCEQVIGFDINAEDFL